MVKQASTPALACAWKHDILCLDPQECNEFVAMLQKKGYKIQSLGDIKDRKTYAARPQSLSQPIPTGLDGEEANSCSLAIMWLQAPSWWVPHLFASCHQIQEIASAARRVCAELMYLPGVACQSRLRRGSGFPVSSELPSHEDKKARSRQSTNPPIH